MNYQKGFIAPLLLIIIATILIGGGVYVANYTVPEQQPVIASSTQSANAAIAGTAGKCGLMIGSINANTKVSIPLTISGTIDNTKATTLGCAWQMFEGQGGTAELYYLNEGKWVPIGGSVIKVANWATTTTTFTTTLNYTNTKIQLPTGTHNR